MRRITTVAAVLAHGIALGGCEDASTGEYGSVQIQLGRGDTSTDPFAGSPQMHVRAHYGACLEAFYRDRPEARFDAAEGSAIVERWKDQVCSESDGSGCSVTSITQDVEACAGDCSLTLDYAITGDLDDREFAFGPLPTVATADCPAGEVPTVTIAEFVVRRGDEEIGHGASEIPVGPGETIVLVMLP